METKIPSWIKWLIVVLLIAIVVLVYIVMNSNISRDIQKQVAKKESAQEQINSISTKQNQLHDSVHSRVTSDIQKANTIIETIQNEKTPIIIPSSDSIDSFIAAYKFTE